MRKRSIFIAGVISLVGLIAFTAYKPVPAGPSANGQGAILTNYMNGQIQHFSFHAVTDKDGNVSGSWESKSPGQDVRTHGEITCLTILPDGKTAILTGIVTQKTGEGQPGYFLPGSPIWLKVVDNGEGKNSGGDQFSDYYASGAACGNFNVAMYTLENGNIQVKP